MRKALALICIVLGSFLMLSAPTVGADEGGTQDKVTICHRTNSNTNPYVKITVDRHAVDGEASRGQADHYGEHQGPVWNPSLKAQKIEWGDIIPPVDEFHDGLNWTDDGRAVYDNGCVPAASTTTTEATTTTVEETTTTVKVDDTLIPPTSVDNDVNARSANRVTELPRTGSGTTVLTFVGVALVLAGTVLTVRYRDGYKPQHLRP